MNGRSLAGHLLVLASFFASGLASAHHGGGTTFAAPARDVTTPTRLDAPFPRWTTSLGYGISHRSRLREGSDLYPADVGTLTHQTVSLDTKLELSVGAFGVRQPFGAVSSRPVGESRRVLLGFGDTSLHAETSLPFAFRTEAPTLLVTPQVGLVLPTGRYESDALLSLSEARVGADGDVVLLTHDTRSSPGADVFATSGSVEITWRSRPQTAGSLLLLSLVPLSETRDGIQWGPDLAAEFEARFALNPGLVLLGGPDVRWHLQDQVHVVEAETEVTEVRRGGERRELGISLGVSVPIGSSLSCTIRGRLPLWQYTEGVQLMETFSAGSACMVALSL